MTANVHKLIRKKNKMLDKVYNKKQTHDYSVYKQFRNSLKRTIMIAKYTDDEKIINRNENNSKNVADPRTFGKLQKKKNKVPQSIVSSQGDELYDP